MIDEFWFMNIESIVFDKIKKKSMPYLRPKYKGINFVSQELVQKPAKFPCVEIRELEGVEEGQTLDNTTIPAYRSTFQVNVYAEKPQIAKDVMSEIAIHFKKDLLFNIVAMPVRAYNGDIHRYSARFRRVIASNDAIANTGE